MAISTINQNGLNAPLTLTSPVLTTPNLGTPSAINLANATNLSWAAMPAGSVIQTVYAQPAGVTFTFNTTFQNSGSVTITPKFSNSLIAVWYTGLWYPYDGSPSTNNQVGIVGQLVRGSTASTNYLMGQNYWEIQVSGAQTYTYYGNQTYQGVDAPATTSAVTYTLFVASWGASTATSYVRTASQSMIAMEIKQ